MSKKCDRCGKELAKNVSLFSVNHEPPSEGRKYACWECLTLEERVRHMRYKPKETNDEQTR